LGKAENLEDLIIYVLSMEIGEIIWETVNSWDSFSKDTLGKQFVKAVDSISANIAEGFGRFSFKESIQFYYYSRGSLYESKSWLKKAYNRKLITENQNRIIQEKLEKLGAMLNKFITSIKDISRNSE
jgi:four helix bundle protein